MVPPVTRPLFLLSKSAVLDANLRAVVEPPFIIHRVSDWPGLKRALSVASPTSVCFADATYGSGGECGLAEGLREVTSRFPLLAVVACVSLRPDNLTALSALQQWGVAELLDLDREITPAATARRLHEIKGFWAARLIDRAFARSLTPKGRILLEKAANVAADGGKVPDFARELGLSKRTIPRWCELAGIPEPRRTFAWIRLLVAGELLDTPRRSIEQAARAAGFSSAGSLKSTTRAFTNLTPSDLREHGAFETVAALARSEFRATKDAARDSPRYESSWFN